jgi:hypothetical protein
LAKDDGGLVGRVDFHSACFALNGFHSFNAGGEGGGTFHNARTGQSHGALLKIGRIGRHDDRAREAFFSTSPTQSLSMVATRMGNNPSSGQARALQFEQSVLDPSHLEGPGALKVFALKKE